MNSSDCIIMIKRITEKKACRIQNFQDSCRLVYWQSEREVRKQSGSPRCNRQSYQNQHRRPSLEIWSYAT